MFQKNRRKQRRFFKEKTKKIKKSRRYNQTQRMSKIGAN